MDLTSLQVCMDSSQWLQGTIIDEECGMDSTSPCGGDMLTCSRPLNHGERRLRPQHDQALKCPRCDSTHTKFCYYNNYSLSQPRYFCKTCRRYWTKGGTLRNIPVGGGCRRNKKVATKKPTDHSHNNNNNQSPNMNHSGIGSSSPSPTELQLSFPKLHHPAADNTGGFMESKYNDIMERRLEAIVGNCSRNNYDFMGGDQLGLVVGLGDHHHGLLAPHGQVNYDQGNFMDMGWQQRMMMMLPDHQHDAIMDVKPNTKLLSLDWQDQGRSETGYNLGTTWSTTGMMNNNNNNYGPSTTNPLV